MIPVGGLGVGSETVVRRWPRASTGSLFGGVHPIAIIGVGLWGHPVKDIHRSWPRVSTISTRH